MWQADGEHEPDSRISGEGGGSKARAGRLSADYLAVPRAHGYNPDTSAAVDLPHGDPEGETPSSAAAFLNLGALFASRLTIRHRVYKPPMEKSLYESLYEAEWLRRDQLQAAVGTPVGVLTLLGGALVIVAERFETSSPVLAAWFWTSFGIACAAFLLSVYMLVRSFYGWLYERIPLPSQLREYERGLIEYHKATGSDQHAAATEMRQFLDERYVVAGDRNAVNNATRAEYLHQANKWLVVALGAVALCAAPFVIAAKRAPPKPQKVEILNLPPQVNRNARRDTVKPQPGNPGDNQSGPASQAGTAAQRPAPRQRHNTDPEERKN
jgi:hypothetical protein